MRQKENKNKMRVSYANLKLKTKDEIKTFNFNNTEIEVKQYLPISEKESLIDSVLQKSVIRGVYNPLAVEMYFNLNIIYL